MTCHRKKSFETLDNLYKKNKKNVNFSLWGTC